MTTPHQKLRELALAATPGPWECDDHNGRAAIETADGYAVAYPAAFANIKTELAHGRLDSLATAHYIAAANPTVVLALLDEIDQLREQGPLWLQFAIASLHESVDLTDPRCPVGSALTRAGLERVPYQARMEVDDLCSQLAAVTKARDELAEIAEGALHPGKGRIVRPRIAELAKVGR